MRPLISALALCSALIALPTAAQQTSLPAPVAAPAVEASSPGPATLDALMDELYATVSGAAGPRDWDRFKAVFHPNATLIPSGRRSDGSIVTRVMSTDGYIAVNGPLFEQDGFFEREIGRSEILEFGPIVQFQSAYEARRALTDAEPFLRGVNSIVALNDGKRWWILTIAWSAETPETRVPAELVSPTPTATP